jgi:hypothetical protein
MAVEWNKSMSTEATLAKLVTTCVMAEAAIGGWRTSAGENYLDPVLAKLLSLKISIGTDLEILAIPFYENSTITIELASTTSTPTPFLMYLSLSHSASHILASNPTSIYGGTFSISRRKGVRGDPSSWRSIPEPTGRDESRIPECTPEFVHKGLVQEMVLHAARAGVISRL